MSEIGRKGAAQTNQIHERDGFSLDELPELRTLEDAKRALDQIRRGVLTRRITHNEGSSAVRAVGEWCKAENTAITQRLVTALEKELQDKSKEIEELRSQLSGGRKVRAVR